MAGKFCQDRHPASRTGPGVLIALVNMIFEGMGAFSFSSLLATVLIIGAGWLGGQGAARA
jgi:hypothetical protein